jgi:hypothetical protein
VGAVPSPSRFRPVRGLANAEEVAAPTKQNVGEGVEEAGRKSPLTQLQMIIESDKRRCFFSFFSYP